VETQPWFLPHFGCGGKAGPGPVPVIGGGIGCFELQLSEHEVGEGAWPFPLAWVPGESAPNSCLLGRTQAKAALGLYLLEVVGACCISSKHGFHLVALVSPGRVFARNWKPCLELVLCSGRAVGIRCAELGFWGFSKSLVSRIGWNPSSGNMKLGRWLGLFR